MQKSSPQQPRGPAGPRGAAQALVAGPGSTAEPAAWREGVRCRPAERRGGSRAHNALSGPGRTPRRAASPRRLGFVFLSRKRTWQRRVGLCVLATCRGLNFSNIK